MKDEKKRVHVLTHTHWDREWYLPFEFFRERLVKLIDDLLQIMAKDPGYRFSLDGQTIVLEDYEEVGKNLEDLLSLIRKGRIQVGPWYVLPDEFLISGESWIRNYLYSESLSRRYRIPLMKVAYLPDMFGHNAYMPTILKGLGMKWAVMWRGVGDSNVPTFIWRSPHGDEVKVYHLINGYGNAAHFGRGREYLKKRLIEEAENLSRSHGENDILLMNGTDHEFPVSYITELLKEISDGKFEFMQSDLENYVSSLAEPEKIFEGELRCPRKEPILKDVTSTRISGKQMHFEAELLYRHYVEPLAALVKLEGMETISDEIWYGWKLILQSQPHDSICGCVTDEVYESVIDRFRRAINHGKMLCSKYMIMLAGNPISDFGLLVFNPLERARKDVVETVVYLPEGEWKVEGAEKSYLEPLNELSSSKEALTHKFLVEPFVNGVLSEDLKPYRCFFLAELPALSFKTFRIVPGDHGSDDPEKHSFAELKNNGSLKIKWKGKAYDNFCHLKDVDDGGDEYNYSPVCEEVHTSLSIEADVKGVISTSWVERKRADFVLRLPESLSADRRRRSSNLVDIPVTVEYTFHRATPRVDVKIDLENRAKDHRLTVVFPVRNVRKIFTDGYFGLVEHEIKEYSEDYKDWFEKPANTFAMLSIVTVPEESFTIVTRGLHEVHVTEEGIELTLLRCVEWLSRDDLKTRKEHAGPMIFTPGAQELGKHTFKFSIVFHEKWSVEEVYRAMREVLVTPMVYQGYFDVPKIQSPFAIKRGFMSAMKPSEDGKGVILRVFEPGGGTPEVSFACKKKEVDMAEKDLNENEEVKSVRTWKLESGVLEFD